MANLYIWIFALNLARSYGFYFDGQPRILSSDGNLIVESAKNRNISFYLQGTGCLNINDINILKVIEIADRQGLSGNIFDRMVAAENSIADLNFRSGLQSTRIRSILNGQRNHSTLFPVVQFRLIMIQSRITSLETRMRGLLNILNEDNCQSNPCQNGGACVDMFNDYQCRCTSNWEGKSCDVDVNECLMFAGTELGCQNGASCVNTPGAYSCSCTPGWQGIHCTRLTVDCASSGNELCGHGSCIPVTNSIGYKCICDQGWKTNGVSQACTVDIDECSEMKQHCSKDPPVQCMNLPGSFMCGLCPAGFSGNGYYCSDINECDVNNGGCSTTPTVQCINTRGSHFCGNCPPGWQGDGKNCIRSEGGSSSSSGLCSRPDLCHPLATCVQSGLDTFCICPNGYTGSGFGSIGCSPRAATLHPCSVSPCQNGGTCISNGTTYTCQCPPGTDPPHCANSFNPCLPNPCRNGGTCSRPQGINYRCACLPSFTGNLCETERNECGGVLNSQSGTLKYPLYNSYPHNTRCAWLIKTNNTQVLNVTFTKFVMEPSSECRFDWLQIHDGRSSSSHMIGRFCGAALPKGGNIISTTNMLYLWFRSDNSSSHDGFELSWESRKPICGGIIETNSHGTISSPGAPGNYPPNRDCEWEISTEVGKRIQFQFFTMQLEVHETCQYDYVEIYSGSRDSGVLLNKFCNTSHPEPLTTPANEAVVTFHSDDSGSDAGFQIHFTVIEGIPGCGGVFTLSSGEFGPPTQNGEYQKNMKCEYLIRMPTNSRIQIKFKDFHLEDSRECDFDYVEIFEGSTEQDPKVNRYCGHQTPPDYMSLGNILLIVFKSDYSATFEGFRVNYELVCGGLFENATGTFTSPFYPRPYEHSRTCYYEINGPPGNAISLVFEDFDLEDTSYPDCDFDFVQIFDGFDVNSTQIGKYCGATIPPNSVSTLNSMLVALTSDSSISSKGFKASYSLINIKCGGVIKKTGVPITPPMHSHGLSYENEAHCIWVFVAPKGYIVQLTFNSFSLEHTSDCSLDYVTLYEGTINGTKIGSYCGTNTPPVIQSNRNVLSLEFGSDASLTREGFTASYNFIDYRQACGGTFHVPTGNIRSPGWPDNYVDNKDCIWIIIAPTGQQIQLTINTFEIEEHLECTLDYLEIRNGGSSQSPLIGKYCGSLIPKVIRSYTNEMHIQFKTDSSRTFKGFDIDYDSTFSGCGGNINNLVRGSIVSPNYPHPYGVNSQCDWRITVSKGSIVQLLFSDLELEDHDECYFDFVEIFDGRSSASKSLGKFCSIAKVPSQILSSTNEVFIRMVSDFNNQGRGFDLKFTAICTLVLNKHRGVIESPNFPNKYGNNLKCEWTVNAPPGNKIFVAFSQFELETNNEGYSPGFQGCIYDYLEIVQKKSQSIEVVESEKYCSKMPKEFSSIGDTVVFKFNTDSSVAANGFHLEYEIEGCGGEFTRPSGNFTTPNYPKVYPAGVTCEWSIIVSYGEIIELTINDLDIESTLGCYDSLEISSRKNDSHPLNTYCHSIKQPVVLTSHSNELYVKFTADRTHFGKGFSASYTTKPLKCGGIFKSRQSTFSSPKYPSNYDDNLYCEWFLEVEENHKVSLAFMDFSTENSCIHDSVKIYDGFEKTEDKILATLCGSDSAITKTIYNSTENKMLVVMQTDDSLNAKGFSAGFRTACGGLLTVNESGVIDMDSYTGYEGNSCNWTIVAPRAEQHVTLTIVTLKSMLQLGTFCLVNILIYDGIDTKAPLSKNICTDVHPPPIVSSGNSLTISINHHNPYHGFKLKAYYTTLENTCGGSFSTGNGHIASPSYPNSYPVNVECEWDLRASPGNRLILSVEKFDIEESENCNEDYLEIRENDISGKLLGVYCGNNIPINLPQSERFWLKFRSNSEGVGAGFLAQYSYVAAVEIDGTSGVITSPLYPALLGHSLQTYTYRITVKFGFYISLVIKEFSSNTAIGLMIYDGYDENAPSEEVRNLQDNPIVSSSNVMFISTGNVYLLEMLFKLEWNEVSERKVQTDNETQTTNCTDNSIVYINNSASVNIISPGYPHGYEAHMNCTWILKPDQDGYHVSIELVEVDLEDTYDCLADYVAVSSSNDLSTYKLLNKTCQYMSGKSTTIGWTSLIHGDPYLKLNFVTDYYNNRTGFLATAKSMCGGPMYGPSGVITVIRESSCAWSITVRRGRTIKFEFLMIDIQRRATNECVNYVLLKNGGTTESPFLGAGKYCGTEIPIVDKTSSNRANVIFNGERGRMLTSSFTLRYEEVTHDCGGTVVFNGENYTIIQTPNYPNIPPPHIECIWSIIVPSGELIQVNFIERFDIRNSTNCEEEYVEIRDGGTVNGNLVGKFCGKMPETQYSKSNMLRIKYNTDIPMPMNGFKANISLAKCGGFYRSKSGFIQSTNYPGLGSYETNSICEYNLIGTDGSNMNLTFIDLHLPYAENCDETDHVEIFNIIPSADSDETTLDEIGRYCGSDRTPEPIQGSSEVLVRFVTHKANSEYRGFRISFNSSIQRCGGEITAESGFVKSPGYPYGTVVRQYCEWRIKVPKGRRVKAEIMDFDFSDVPLLQGRRTALFHRILLSQSVTFYNDFSFFSRAKRVVKNESTDPIYSSDNLMLIILWLRNNAGHRGLKLRFSSDEPSICGGNLNENEGILMSPVNVSTYACEYQRDQGKPFISSANNAGTMGIYITEDSFYRSTFCTSISPIYIDYLPKTRSRNFVVNCNKTNEFPPIASPFAELKIVTRKAPYRSYSGGYKIEYKINNCGQRISNTQEITIRNPTFSADYGRVACAWQYKTVENSPIAISGSYENLDCAIERLTIYSSPFPPNLAIQTFCGESSNKSINYTFPRFINSIFIEYHSSSYNPNTTFELYIKSNYVVCGGRIENPLFKFSSPLNGSQYPNNIECIWDISTSIGYHIGVTFIDRFFLEESENCTNDYIEIFDFVEGDWKLLSRVCGRTIPGPFNSTGSQARVIFRTNENVVGEGFTIKWEENCGGILLVTKDQHILTSPKYPNNYPSNIKCNYTLIAGREDFINVDFDEFQLEGTSRSCNFDNLTIYKYEDWTYPPGSPTRVGSYCWKDSLTHIRYKHKINLIFSSDDFVQNRGFSSKYYLDNCGGNVTNSSIIEVPRKEAGKYADFLTCLWYIKAPDNKKIIIRFEYFDVEHNDGCYLDSVDVYQGLQTDIEHRKATLCGNLTQHAPIINIDSNNAIVKFHSDVANGAGGFSALIFFGEKCDKTIELNDKSPSYKLDKVETSYPPYLDCHYVITVPEGYQVKIEFEHFHIANCLHDNSSCACDYLAIFDGSNTFAEPIQQNLCGDILPQTITSSGSSLIIRYVTDSVFSSSGFSANIKMEPPLCGKLFIRLNSTFSEHTLSWPISSTSYPPNSRCDWIIEAPPGEQIDIRFESFELEDSDPEARCSSDFLQLTDDHATLQNTEGLGSTFVFAGGKQRVLRPLFYWGKSFPSAPHEYCGSGIPNDFVSSSERVKVRFRSNESIQKGGFRLIARMTPACHRNYTSLQGRMYSKKLTDCETFITVPENYTISLYFSVFNVYLIDTSFQCTNESAPFKIFDHRQNHLIQHICPGLVPNPVFANTNSIMIKSKQIQLAWIDINGIYDITYLATDKGLGCGGQIFNYAGQFSSPMYPANDRNASDCRWDITVPQNLVVSINFGAFDMGSTVTCHDNYIQIIETDNDGKETVIRQYCGEDRPSAYKSMKNIISIRFRKTANFAGTGWILQFMGVHPSAIVS